MMVKLKNLILTATLLFTLPIIYPYEKRTKEEKFVDSRVEVHRIHVKNIEKYFMECISDKFLDNSERINILMRLKNIEYYSDKSIDLIWSHDEVYKQINWEEYYGKFDYSDDYRKLGNLLLYKSHIEAEQILKEYDINIAIKPYTPEVFPFSN